MRGKDIFLQAGGESLDLIPCLNEHPLWLDTLENMTRNFLSQSHPSQERSETEQDDD